MAHIQKLAIQGVRSFDPEKPQEIKFFPLTLIVGPNGAGKTTIIEALKYATTGSLPPNCNNGQSFVHDVLFAGKPIIRGLIRLKFTDVEKKSTTVTRRIQAAMKMKSNKATITFKQLTPDITRGDQSNDLKVADMNGGILDLVGISKAVLTNVVFCHQEDTNWPLSEGKVLKEKFDDIFGSLGYVKVLDKIKKTRDEQAKNLRLLEKDVVIYGNLKKEADDIQKSMDKESDKLFKEKTKNNDFQKEIKKVSEQLDDLTQKESSAVDLMGEISQIEGSIAEKKKLAEGIKKNCNDETLSKTETEVDQELKDFDENSRNMIVQKDKLEKNLEQLESSYSKLSSDKKEIEEDISHFKQCERQIKTLTSERNNLIGKIENRSNELELLLNKINDQAVLSESECRTVVQHYEDHIEQLHTSIAEKNCAIQKQDLEMRKQLESFKSKKSNSTHEKNLRQTDIENVKKELTKISHKLSSSSVSENAIKSLDEKIVHFQSLLSKLDDVNEDEMKKSITQLTAAKRELNEAIEGLEKQISIANANKAEKIKFDFLIAQKEERESKVRAIREANSEVYCEIDADEGNFSAKLNEHIGKFVSQHDQLNGQVALKEKEFCTDKSQLESQEKLLHKRVKELASHKDKFTGLCEIARFESFLKLKENELITLRSEMASLSNLSPVIDSQIVSIDKHEMCPVCENDLSISWISKHSGNNLDRLSLVKKLEKAKCDNPEEVKQIAQKVKDAEQMYNKVLRLESDYNAIHNIESEIKSLKTDLSNLTEKIDTLNNSIDKEKMKLKRTREKIESLRKCSLDANQHDNSCKELKDIKRKLECIDSSKWSDGEDIESLSGKLEERQSNLKATEKELVELQDKLYQTSKEKYKLQNSLQNAERNKSEFERQERDKLESLSKQKDLKAQLEDLQSKVEELDQKSHEFDPDIERLEAELRTLARELKDFEMGQNKNIYSFQEIIKRMNGLFNELNKQSEELAVLKLKTSKEYIDELEGKIKKAELEITTWSKQLKQLSENITKLELQKRELLDYHRYLELQSSIVVQEEKLKENHKKMGYMDVTTITSSKSKAEKELVSLETQSRNALAQIRELDERIEELSAKLSKDEYATADKKFKEKTIESTICNITCEDLNKYYKALDYSISSFHKCKMEEINKLLMKFWEIAYQGKDIDYIKILSDEEERSATDKRRSYNYRVAMIRNGKEMDMKGRCSAGQKVLASLIIRLALAVIFCRHFAVLTLDEPTTNLDKANIHSFAKAVISLIKSNRNFQIIIITHDEEFLDCLDTDTGEFYYKVFKNDSGYSTIIRKSIKQDTNSFITQPNKNGNKLNDSKRPNENGDDDDEGVHLLLAPKRARVDNNTAVSTKSDEQKDFPSSGNSFFNLSSFDEGLDHD